MTRRTNKDTLVDRYIQRRKRNRCTDCKRRYPYYVMTFDHVPGRGTKLFGLSKVRNHTMQEVIDELKKCDLVCANCHAKRTHRRRKP
jgi:hypothetical protein